ncbi:P-loop NTPase fold protein [Actinoplanes sp. CA-131856]
MAHVRLDTVNSLSKVDSSGGVLMPDQIRALTSLTLHDGSFALAALTGSEIVFYDIKGVRSSDSAVPVGRVNAMARVAGDGGDLLATGGNDAEVALWDPRTRQRVSVPLVEDVGDLNSMTALAPADGRRLVVAGTSDGWVLRCDVESRTWVRPPLDAGLQAVWALEAMPLADGRSLLVSGGEDRSLRVWDPGSGVLLHEVQNAHDRAVRALAFIPGSAGAGERLASADDSGVIKLWEAGETLSLLRKLDHRHHQPVSTLAVMPSRGSDPATLISAGKDEFIRRWTIDGDPIEPASLGHIGSVTAVVATVTPKGDRVLASAGADAKVWIWNVDSGEPRFAPPSLGRIHSMVAATIEDTPMLVTSGDDGRIRLHDPTSPQSTPEVLRGGHQKNAFRVAWLPDRLPGLGLVSAGADGRLLHWADRGAAPVELARDLGRLWTVCDIELPGGRPGVACAGDNGVFTFDPDTGEIREIFDEPTYALVSGELTDRSQGVAAASHDGVIRLLNPAVKDPVRIWDEHEGPVRCLAKVLRPGERNSLLSAGADGTVRIWDTRTGSHILVRHDGLVLDLLVLDMPDGRQLLLSTGEDGRVNYLDLNAIDVPGRIDTGLTVVSALCAVQPDGAVHTALGGGDGGIHLADITAQYGDLRFGGASDRAVRLDRLHRKNLIAEMVDLLSRSADGADEAGPTVLSAEGAWGSGKSSMLEVVRGRLDAATPAPFRPRRRRRLTAARADILLGRPSPWNSLKTLAGDLRAPRQAEQPPVRRWVTAWFNPWAHQTSEQVWAGLTRSILEAAGKALYPAEPVTGATPPADSRWERFRERRRNRRNERRGEDGKEWYWLERNRRHTRTRQLRWTLRKRAASPLLAVAVVALLVPLTARLVDPAVEYSVLGRELRGVQVAMALPVVLLLLGLLHSAVRYYFGRASRWLPAELFTGPLASGGQSSAAAALPEPIRDPLYSARAGYLYLVQHDVGAVLDDLKREGVEVIVFVDDLDRCSPKITAEVLEAINLFLSERLTGARFVLGLDPAIVAAHLDDVYASLASRRSAISSEDPSFGWTFLRKLIQLPVVLPRLWDTTVDRLISDLLRPAMTEARPPGTPEVTGGRPARSPQAVTETASAEAETASGADSGPAQPVHVVMTVARERHPQVRTLLAERIKDLPDRSPREIKRLLTVWQYYVRVLDRADSKNRSEGTDLKIRARHLVIFAEVITRWPALRSRLQASTVPPEDKFGREGPPASGWRVMDELALVAADDSEWNRALHRLKFTDDADRKAMRNLRKLLRDYDGPAVAELARRIW